MINERIDVILNPKSEESKRIKVHVVLGMTSSKMIIEICANSFKSAKIAQESGADRIELCEDLSVGGLTPSRDLIKEVMQELSIPVHVLIRPRKGDFIYSEVEFAEMLADIAFSKEMGCKGVVSGVLTSEKNVDVERTKRLIYAAEGMEFTFHRAFDYCNEPLLQFELLKQLGVTRLLSSGQAVNAVAGIELLKKLKAISDRVPSVASAEAQETVQIMPGGGINSENALLFKQTGFEMIHFSATNKVPHADKSDLLHTEVTGHSNPEEIKKIIRLLA